MYQTSNIPDPFVPSSPAAIEPGVPLRFALMVYRTQIADLAVTPVVVHPDGSTKEAAVTLVGRHETGVFAQSAAEIPAFDAASKRGFKAVPLDATVSFDLKSTVT